MARRAAKRGTHLTVELSARTAGRPAVQQSLARLPITVSAGTVVLRITLSTKAKQALLADAAGTLEIVVRGTSNRAQRATLQRTITLQGG